MVNDIILRYKHNTRWPRTTQAHHTQQPCLLFPPPPSEDLFILFVFDRTVYVLRTQMTHQGKLFEHHFKRILPRFLGDHSRFRESRRHRPPPSHQQKHGRNPEATWESASMLGPRGKALRAALASAELPDDPEPLGACVVAVPSAQGLADSSLEQMASPTTSIKVQNNHPVIFSGVF